MNSVDTGSRGSHTDLHAETRAKQGRTSLVPLRPTRAPSLMWISICVNGHLELQFLQRFEAKCALSFAVDTLRFAHAGAAAARLPGYLLCGCS